MPVAAQLQPGHVCSVCDSPSLIRTDGRGECRDSCSQGSVIGGTRNEQFSTAASALPGWSNREYQQRHHRERTNPQKKRAMEKHFEIPYLTNCQGVTRANWQNNCVGENRSCRQSSASTIGRSR